MSKSPSGKAKTYAIFNVQLMAWSPAELSRKLSDILARSTALTHITTPNTEMVIRARTDKTFADVLNSAEINVLDGIGLVWALRFLYGLRAQRISGVDLVENIIELMQQQGKGRVLFIGRNDGLDPASPQKAAAILTKKHPKLTIAGKSFAVDRVDVASINEFEPDLLVVCLGAPVQDLWIADHVHELKSVKIAIGAGATADFIAGSQKRAPKVWQKLGLEWFYRLIRQPKRIFRQLAIPYFMWLVLLSKLRQQK